MVAVRVLLMLTAVLPLTNAMVDVCQNPSGSINRTQKIDGPWKFTSENCSMKNSAIVIHFKDIERHCSSSRQHHIRIAGHNFCKLRTGSCLVLQRDWRICDNIKNGFQECSSKVWIFNKTSSPVVRIKKNITVQPLQITYHYVKCKKSKEMKLSSSNEVVVALGIMLGIAVIAVALLLVILFRSRLAKLFTKKQVLSVEPQPESTSSQAFVERDHCNDAYAVASEQNNVEPIYEMAEEFPGAQMSIPPA